MAILAMALASFVIPAFHMPQVPRVQPLTIQAPGAGASFAVTLGYMAVSGALAGLSPLFLVASLCLGALLFVYNKSRIPAYSRYYLIGAFVIFYAFEYQMTLPGGVEGSMLGFEAMMFMAIASLLLALIAQELSPAFAARAAKNEGVRVTYFIFLGALVALVLVLYGGYAQMPAIGYAATGNDFLLWLLVYNLFALAPSALVFWLLGNNRLALRTPLANNKESIILIGTVLVLVAVLAIEVFSFFAG